MPWPEGSLGELDAPLQTGEGSRGEHDAPLQTGEGSRGEHDAPLPMGEGSRGERDAPRTSEPTGKHLYLVFDDWPWGYSIRKLKLPIRRQLSLRPLEPCRLQHKRLLPPCVQLEATRRLPSFFGAVGTNIIAAHPRNDVLLPECILPIFDVRSLGVRFGPGLLYSAEPIFITVGDKELFALDVESFRMLSMEPFCPLNEWSWCDLPSPPLKSMEVTSFAVGSDGRTIFASTESATFAFDIVNSEWKRSSDCSLPFYGPANYVHALNIFVGLSKAPDTYGHLCYCSKLGGDEDVRPGKENLLTKDPAERHEGATLVYLGGSEPGFCLVECVSIAKGKSVNKRLEECDQLVKCVDEGDGASRSICDSYKFLYRLTTFSLSFDKNRDLTTGETCVVQRYKVPKEVSDAIYLEDPVAFWL